MKKNSGVKTLLEARKIAFTMKNTKFGEIVFQCVIFRKIAKITEGTNNIFIEFPFGEFPQRRFNTLREFEIYLENGGN